MYHLDNFPQIFIPPLKVQTINLNSPQRMQQQKKNNLEMLHGLFNFSPVSPMTEILIFSQLEESLQRSCLGESPAVQS